MHECAHVCVCARELLFVFQILSPKPSSQSQLCINYKQRDATSSCNSSPRFSLEGQGSGVGKPSRVNRGALGVRVSPGRKKVARHPDQRVGDKGGPVCSTQNQTEPRRLFCGPPRNFSITKRIPPSCFHLTPPPPLAPPPEGTPLDL